MLVNFVKCYKNYATFSGRAKRKEFWGFVLILIIASAALSLADASLGWAGQVGPVGPLASLFALVSIIPLLAVGVRRLHDAGRSAFYMLLVIVPVIGWILLFIVMIAKSK